MVISTTRELMTRWTMFLSLWLGACSESRTVEAVDQIRSSVDPATISFQDGVLPTTGYFGTTDTTINQATPSSPHTTIDVCSIDGDTSSGNDYACLLRWTLTGIPPGSTVQSASITLTVTSVTLQTYEIYGLLKSWDEAQATWNQAGAATAWATPGAQGSTDRSSTVIGTIGQSSTGAVTFPLNAAGVALVQGWLDGAPNHGIIIADTTNDDGFGFRSRNYTTASSRPKLNVTHLPPDPSSGGVEQTIAFIDRHSTWKYLDNGSDQGTAWRATNFSDASWPSGMARLGYGDGDEQTVINSGPSGAFFITSYFRKEFNVADPGQLRDLTMLLVRDDGAIVYLNGNEIYRSNMPSGTVTAATRASDSTPDEHRSFVTSISPAALQVGKNVVAVEVHQSSPGSSDVIFELELTGRTIGGPTQTSGGPLIAFIGDQGNEPSSDEVLQLIEDEGAAAVVHNGDFDYESNPTVWETRINTILGSNYPYFTIVGNHDAEAWEQDLSGGPGYADYIRARRDRVPAMQQNCQGEIGVKATCRFQGVLIVQSCVGTSELEDTPSDCRRDSSEQVAFIEQSLNDAATWKICAWHKNQHDMQLGSKSDAVGWEAYKRCMNAGAIVATGHEHSYSRTLTLSGVGVAPNHGAIGAFHVMQVFPGRNFVFVSGVGGEGVRAALDYTDPWWAAQYAENRWFENGSLVSHWDAPLPGDEGRFGALFIRFNVGGNPARAHGYFKDLYGRVIDSFEIHAN